MSVMASLINHQRLKCLLNSYCSGADQIKHQLRVTGLCEGNSAVAQRASDAENVSIWWRHHVHSILIVPVNQYASLTHWGWVTHMCVSNLTIIGSDNGRGAWMAPSHYLDQYGILLIGLLRNLITICTLSFKKTHLKMSSGKWRPFCIGLNEFN